MAPSTSPGPAATILSIALLAAHAADMRLRYAGAVEASRRQLSEAEPPAATGGLVATLPRARMHSASRGQL